MIRSFVSFTVVLVLGLAAFAPNASAQVLNAYDDEYSIPFGFTLIVEFFGVMDNDILDDEAAGELGATVELVTDVGFGTLALAADGSFSYSIGPSFDGFDSFVYRVVFAGVSSEATVVLTACDGGPDVFVCWSENAFMVKAAELGLASFTEGFEDDVAWGMARSPYTTASVSSQGVLWTSNHTYDPAFNEITTGPGPARTGLYGIYDLEHGYATGTPSTCDVEFPAEHCLYKDGWTGTREVGESVLYGVGGWITGTYGATVSITIDGGPYLGGHKFADGGHHFMGVIDTRPAGFRQFSYVETDGKVGQQFLIFADDFTFLTPAPTGVSTQEDEPTGVFFAGAGPNPSDGNTVFRFTLADPTEVRLVIYDQRGRLVRELNDSFRSGGSHAVAWDGRDQSGRTAAAGTYFGRLILSRDGRQDVLTRKVAVTR